MSYSHVHFLADDNIKKQAFEIIENHGLTPTQMFNLVLEEIAQTRVLPIQFIQKNHHDMIEITPRNNLAEKLACDDGLDIEFERVDLNLREVNWS